MRAREAAYLVIGLGIIVKGSLEHRLEPAELGAATFLLGLIPAERLDRRYREKRGDHDTRTLVERIFGGRDDGRSRDDRPEQDRD